VWSHPTAADLDGDGDIDLIGTGGITFGAVLLRNDGPGPDWFVDSLPEVDVSFGTVVADWDGDGRVDLAIPGASRNRFSVLLNRTPPSSSRDENRDGVPDECAPAAVRFLRGDCTTDGTVDLTDAICILGRLFAGEEARCATALNANGDLEVNLTDAVFVLGFLFGSGAQPVEPFPDCGPGVLPADAKLGCESPPDCR
jgi:hypothetical protein